MQFFRRLKRKKGFTITELIIVVALIGIMMATLTAFSEPVREMVGKTRAKNDVLTINNIIGNYLEHNLAYASEAVICVGWDLIASHDELDTIFTNLKSSWSGANDRPAAMIIHYDRDNDTQLRNTFRLYEYDKDSNLPAYTTTIDGVDYVVMDESKLVFHDDFYDDYAFTITVDESDIIKNKFREREFIRFTVSAYEFDGALLKSDGSEAYLTRGDIKSHYQNLDDPTITDQMTQGYYTSAFVGSENVFFKFQNIKAKEAKRFDILRGCTDGTTGTVTYGDDIVIFYNIRQFKYGSSS